MGKILRRTFLIGTAAIAGGVAFGTYYVKSDYDNPLKGKTADGEVTFNPYVKITADNSVTIIVPRAEMGQGVSTSLAALVAEELDVAMASIKVEHGPASNAYYNAAMLEEGAPFPAYQRDMIANMTRSAMGSLGKVLGIQMTGGSTATIDAFDRMREAGCAARETLKLAAAKRLGVSADRLETENGHVIHDETKIPYGELAEAASKLDPPSGMELKPQAEWKILGQSVPRTDVVAKSTGAPIFGIDVRLPEMLYATVRMNPRRGGKMESFDASEAEKMRDVVKIIDVTGPEGEDIFGGGFAVIAKNTWAAFKAADAVKVKWGEADYPATSAEHYKRVEEAFGNKDTEALVEEVGDTSLQFADAARDKVVEAEYRVPYLAHATMEPMNATAWLRDGKLDVWSGNQAPTIIRNDVAWEAGVEPENVEIHTTYMGGGFGRRVEVDFSRFATRVAKHTDGRPVQVVWTREEDMSHDTYRPISIGRMRGLVGDDGLPQALELKAASPSILANLMARTFPSMSPMGPDDTMAQGLKGPPYAIPNYKATTHKADLSIPIGFWRSVGHSFNAWYYESFLDEMAAAAGQDPLEMRRALMADFKPALGVIDKVAQMSNWSEPAVPGRGKGVAFHLSFASWVAQVVEVSLDDDEVKIENVWCAADLGTVLDPAIVKAQMQSGIIFGLSAALGQEITFVDGAAEQMNFDTYDAMRMAQCPNIQVELLNNSSHMGGAGEPGTPPAIPALANAIFAATGKRIRQMPLSKEVDFA